MMRLWLGAMVAMSVAIAAAAEPSTLELKASVVLQMISERGARATIEAMWGTTYPAAMEQVALGSDEWLTVAEQLHPGSDAGSSSMLRDAVAWALPKAPERVLLKIAANGAAGNAGDLFTLGVCDGPPVDFPNDDSTTYYREAVAAVKGVKNPKLKKLRADCLKSLESSAVGSHEHGTPVSQEHSPPGVPPSRDGVQLA